MQIKELQSELENYRNALSHVKQYRKDWKKTKELIFNTLTAVVKKSGMKAQILKEEKLEGMEIIYLTFGKRESGIFERIGEVLHPLMKEGGYLFYTQTYNGKISVYISLPVIENLVDQEAAKSIATYIPTDIDESVVVKNVGSFLKEMTDWEDKTQDQTGIGYKMRQQA